MTYTDIETLNGPYVIDYELLHFMLGQCYYITTLNDSAVETKMSMDGPDIYTVDVNWAAARTAELTGPSTFLSRYKIPNMVTNFFSQSSEVVDAGEIERLRRDLYSLETRALQASQELKDKRNKASDRGMKNIERSVSRAEFGLAAATFIRDASIDGLLLGGTILTGGSLSALVGVAGGVAFLKGGAKYQDTSNLGAAALTVTFEFVTALIPGKGATKSGTYALVFAKKSLGFQGDLAIGMAEGKSLTESATGAAVKIGVDAAAGPLKPGSLDALKTKLIAGQVLKNKVVPTTVKIIGSDAIEGKAKGFVSEFTTNQVVNSLNAKGNMTKKLNKKVAMGLPLRVDYAVIGPYKSTAPRRFLVNKAAR